MANATVRDKRTEVVVVDEGGITLELTTEEAQHLAGILGKFSGERDTVPFAIFQALDDEGVEYVSGTIKSKRGTSITNVTGILVWSPGQEAW